MMRLSLKSPPLIAVHKQRAGLTAVFQSGLGMFHILSQTGDPLFLVTPMRTIRRLATFALVALLVATLAAPAHAITIDWVTVDDPGNVADDTGYGAVTDSFQIMKYEWTNSQYVDFLNAVDPNGTNPNFVYHTVMGYDARGGISFAGGNAAGSKYAAKTNMGDKPVNFVTWWNAARVANWLENGAQAYGSSDASATAPQNRGAYTLGTATSGTAPRVNSEARFYIPTEDQWYKAAYYLGGRTNAGYSNYATESSFTPQPMSVDENGNGRYGPYNYANYASAAVWNGQQGNVTTVGTNGGPSAYGTFDMSGNVSEWNDVTGAAGSNKGIRGGFWRSNSYVLSSSSRELIYTNYIDDSIGFRLAGPAPLGVPEPSTWAMGLAGIACAGWGAFRRRRQA
ncbi:MAG: SUMF1/EgtB/PvdO family nonheme iron enzyme [Planctomycetota bacterium]|jgi:sulfatase modifying factor 1|nr:SUMF1/EgtB/PvdO family nonheme iron enzyme [Planctomycetota bacterium]